MKASIFLTALVCAFALVLPARLFSAQYPEVSTSVSFDVSQGVMRGTTRIIPNAAGAIAVRTGNLGVLALSLNSKPLEPVIRDGRLRLDAAAGDRIELEFLCTAGEGSECRIEKSGIVLSGLWHPSPEGPFLHALKATVPEGFAAVSEAEEVEVRPAAGGKSYAFVFSHPVGGTSLVAAPFRVIEDRYRDVSLSACFLPEEEDRAADYLAYTKKLLGLYEEMLGPFPFRRMVIAVSPMAGGFSRPTMLVLGREFAGSSSIPVTFLGHEIVHQWLGHAVYADTESGDWTEGIATYLAEHLAAEREGRGWEYRKQLLIEYEAAAGTREMPLRGFRKADSPLSRAVGYGKSALVFHSLKGHVGSEAFFRSLRDFSVKYRFRTASWDDIRKTFEKEAGEDLGWFFRQWVDEARPPGFKVQNISVSPKGLRNSLSFDLVQEEPFFRLDIPVNVQTGQGVVKETLRLREKRQTFEIVTEGIPERLVIDSEYDLFRTLGEEEVPPVIGKLLAAEKGLLVLQEGEDAGAYGDAREFFSKRGFAQVKPGEAGEEDLRKSNVVVIGHDNPVLLRLFGRGSVPAEGFSVEMKTNPLNRSGVIGVMSASSAEETHAAVGLIPRYSQYSAVSFRGGKDTGRTVGESRQGWTIAVREEATGVETAKALSLREIVGRVADRRIIYIGEQHDRYEHHIVQLEMIRELYRRHGEIAVGMEMFQRSSQQALDDYIAGRSDEKEFLRASGYFRKWGIDFHLYKDILRFCRDMKIPVVALNIRREIVNKVSRGGLDSLTAEERQELPRGMDMTDHEYRQRLKEVFGQHEGADGRSFDNFYRSQVIWDEIMAESVDGYLRENPGRRMVVIAGGGHFAFGSGIPERGRRRNGLTYAIILNGEAPEPAAADFVLFPKPVSAQQAPKLMVVLKEEDGRVKITGFPEKSVSEKAGLLRDDSIVALDGEKIGSVEDLQIALFYKLKGDTVRVKVLRPRFLFGESEREFEVVL